MVDLTCIDNKRYRYAFHQSKWIVAGPGEAELPCRVHVHNESPAPGEHWMRQTVSFDKIKLTNNQLDQNGHVCFIIHLFILLANDKINLIIIYLISE
ncbi:hypothetical protein WUBG_18569 [Wuchereria bancrofti]|uniref:T-box domain-containing protein n=1 Tax=Wuchereria bancrofti TaxID=6293 RepID=J9DLQ0_WUCBA|nr:hypothetical protein WUBG_18569 [Wuchereria bancrofti]